MKFFHVYNERCFEGLLKNSMLNEDSGFKIQHVFSMPFDLKFNTFAAKGTRLHSMIKEGNYPFYVDRLAGGTTYHKYDFDPTLISEYSSILGDWFLGFQLHESASNRRYEWKRIMKRMDGEKGPYDADVLLERSRRAYALMPDGTELPGFSQGTAEMYAKMRYAETPEAFHKEIEEMFALRMGETAGKILPCDSYYLYTHMQDKLGMSTFMPEVGCQIPYMRIAIALARGMARNSGKLWGSYYETWIGDLTEGFSMPCYNTEPINEWYLTQEAHPDDFTSCGQNGGSSRRLQKRIYYYTLMSGADYIAEEWGLNCSYNDMTSFELSPYGIAKKEFINDARGLRGIKAVTPFAIVLPRDYECIEIPQVAEVYGEYAIGLHRDSYLDCPLDGRAREYYGHIEDVLKLIYMRNGEIFGNEGHVLTNSRFGDIFDIIYDDASEETFGRYEYLVDATPDGGFARARGGRYKVLESGDLGALEAKIKALESEALPIVVDGLHWLVSEDGKGRRFLTLFNNEGNERSVKHGDLVRREADRRVSVKLREPAELSVVKATSAEVKLCRIDELTYTVDMPATELAIFEF